MKRVVLFLMVFGMATTFAFCQKKETRPVSGFTGIDASSVFDITVAKGNTESLTIEADNEVMPYVRSEVQNGVLHLYLDNKKDIRDIKLLKATLVMKDLDNVSLSGACKLTAGDLFTPDKFKAGCSGASKLTVSLITKQLGVEMSGASQIQIKANVSGDTNINASGTSKIQGELKTGNINFDSSGACSIELTGSSTDMKVNSSGTSNLNAKNFPVKTATVEASGISKVTVNVIDALNVNSSGLSTVNYTGSSTIVLNSSKGAHINKI